MIFLMAIVSMAIFFGVFFYFVKKQIDLKVADSPVNS